MAIRRVSKSSISTTAGKRSNLVAGYSPAVDEMDLIQRVIVGTTPIATITFGSGGTIPQTYQHLKIRWSSRTTSSTGARIRVRFNGDAATNYSAHLVYGNGSVISSAQGSSLNQAGSTAISNSTSLSNVFTAGIIDIIDYKNISKTKTIKQISGVDYNGSGEAMLSSGLWTSTAAITSVTMFWDSGNFDQFSVISLYGVVG